MKELKCEMLKQEKYLFFPAGKLFVEEEILV
jgi:hypothetical protein